jgi:phage regulator Rha-like protein
MATELVRLTDDGTPVTNSLVVATDTGNDHASVIRLIRDNLADFNEVGRVRFEIRPFETAGGTQRREIAIIDELAAMLLMTYLRNTPKVKDFKKRLVLAFAAMRQALAEQNPALTDDEIIHKALTLTVAKVEALTGRVNELEQQAEVDRPAVEYFNTHVVADDDVMLIEDWGRAYGLTKPQAFALLRDTKDLIYPKHFEYWSRSRGRKVTETEYRPRAGKASFTWFDVKEQRDAPRRNNGQARKTLYIKAIHAVDLARLVGLLPNIEVAS